jgi:serine/threonine-protein kinase
MNGSDESHGLEAGLRAAFGGGESARGGVMATLAETVGVHSQILLRDGPDDSGPVLQPGTREFLHGVGETGRYQVLGEIARGGMGVVLKGRDTDLGRDVAIKVLQVAYVHQSSMVQRFVEEAQIAGQLQHPGILPVYELGLGADGRPFFAMKLIRGQTLAALLADRDEVDADRGRYYSIFEHVCQAMAYAHARGVVHRDLKPSNVMVGAFGEIQIVDWGLAKVLALGGRADEVMSKMPVEDAREIETVRSGSSGALSVAGSVMGTPAYMSPEQARGEIDQLDERSDVFALGAMLCEVLTGKPPYEGSRSEALKLAEAGSTFDALDRLRRCGSEDGIVELAVRCLSAAPEQRPRDAGVVAKEFSGYLSRLEERARALELSAAESRVKAAEQKRARRLRLALATAVMLVVMLVLSGSFWFRQQEQARLTQASTMVNDALTPAAVLLGQAKSAPPNDDAIWNNIREKARHVALLADAQAIDAATQERVDRFLDELESAERHRQLVRRFEEIAVVGSTHEDVQSWQWMKAEYQRAFRDYGIDLLVLSPDDVTALILESELRVRLVHNLDLWIRMDFFLEMQGLNSSPIPNRMEWVDVLYEADPDPMRTAIRKQTYIGAPNREKLWVIFRGADLDSLEAETFAILVSAFAMSGDAAGWTEASREAIHRFPENFMLYVQAGYFAAFAQDWITSAAYYRVAVALRPETSGSWQAMGIALHQLEKLDQAVDALERACELESDYGPMYVDLGAVYEDVGREADAAAAYRRAIALTPNVADQFAARGRFKRAQGSHEIALIDFKKCHAVGRFDPNWNQPSADWIAECEAAIRESAGE